MFQKLYSILRYLDEVFLVRSLNFDAYYAFHKALGFPLKRMGFLLAPGYKLNLKNPITFNEKVAYRHLFAKDPLLPEVVDKYKVRSFVEEKIGKQYLVPLLQIANSFDAIDFSALPNEYILKVTHGSGRNIIFKNGKNNKNYNEAELKKTVQNWLVEKYRFQQLIWFVQPIERRVMIEALLKDEDGKIPKDYKFFVFNGCVEMIQVDHDRFEEHKRNLYDREWNRLDLTLTYEQGDLDAEPTLLKEMIALAEKLASSFTFMRVDFYCVSQKIYFGELTPCPGGGIERFVPEEYDVYYGKKWKDHANLMRTS